MNTNATLLLLAATLVFAAPPVRAQDEEAAPSGKPEAAAAARDKGYRAEEAEQKSTEADEAEGPTERHADTRVISAVPQRQLGAGASNGQSGGAGSGGASGGAGKSCEASVPKLTKVYRKELNFFDKINRGTVIKYGLAANEAVTYRFKTPASGAGFLKTEMGSDYRPASVLLSVSETPCDFDTEKALRKDPGCYNWSGGEVRFQIAPANAKGYGSCILKPETYYYFNIRHLNQSETGQPQDSCAAQADFFKSSGIKPVCGGIWVAIGNFKWKDEAAERKNMDISVNNAANIP